MPLNLKKSLKAAAAVAVLFSASMANAALYQFNLTGDYTASWQLNSEVAPDFAIEGMGFGFFDVEGNFPGSLLGVADVTFYNGALGGGLEILDFYGDEYLLVTDSVQLYAGTDEAPTYLTGAFALTQYSGPGTYTLTVTNLDAGPGPGPVPDPTDVPEPATAALLLGGLGLMLASRKRRSQ